MNDVVKIEKPHTPEPWAEGNHSSEIVAKNPDRVLDDSENGPLSYYGGQLIAESVEPRNRRRIVACVNACRGPSTQIIEEGPTYQEMWDEIQAVRKATDDDGTHGGPSVLVEQLVETKAKALRERDEARAMVTELCQKGSEYQELAIKRTNELAEAIEIIREFSERTRALEERWKSPKWGTEDQRHKHTTFIDDLVKVDMKARRRYLHA